jgi:hypothetical protein
MVFLALGCSRSGRRSAPSISVSTALAPSSAAAAASAFDSPPAEQQWIVAKAASFVDEELFSCTEFALTDSPELEAAAAKADAGVQFVFNDDLLTWLQGGKTLLGDLLTRKHGKESVSGLRPSGKPQTLNKTCKDQFSRAVVATCTTTMIGSPNDAGLSTNAALQTVYYQLPDDVTMSRCIAAGSEWTEVAQDSIEWITARNAQLQRRARKLIGN